MRTGYIDVTNIGDTSGTFALGAIGLTRHPWRTSSTSRCATSPRGAPPTVVYSGKLASLSSVALGDMAQGEAHRYRFSVSLPADAGDSYQGASSAVTFLWSATAPEPDVTPTPTPPASTAPGTGTTARPRDDGPGPDRRRPRPAARSSLGATFTRQARQKGTGGKVTGTVTCAATARSP